ncbi:MAG TPA: hypothetical protein VNV25_15340 [Gemmatimonadaceae bacterium]|jgi:acyl-CoA synthetase (AMP-forming)/AMP-acid ligase II|nr:hypothetical protein [Gemmatimonadaceae bacterium]
MEVVDRTKDVIKSGGERISSIMLENIAVLHPHVAEAAAIAVPHPKWIERPPLLVVLRDGTERAVADVLALFEGKIARWWIPDCVVFRRRIAAYGDRKTEQAGASAGLCHALWCDAGIAQRAVQAARWVFPLDSAARSSTTSAHSCSGSSRVTQMGRSGKRRY